MPQRVCTVSECLLSTCGFAALASKSMTCSLRHVWPEVVMENHTHTSAVHGKSQTRNRKTKEIQVSTKDQKNTSN